MHFLSVQSPETLISQKPSSLSIPVGGTSTLFCLHVPRPPGNSGTSGTSVPEPKSLAAVDTRRYPERRSGATRKTTKREDRSIMRQTLVDPTVTRSTIRAEVGVAIVSQTISRHLAEANLKSKRPFRALPLTPEHRQLRLQWCQARSMWNVTDWHKVVFSDESRLVLGIDDNCVRMWRRPV
ncbi:HTH_Tnp_Tc3_2 domain-containing protein [Trichonephila clavipes]|nr:HTH_Tnp_Tc3_2 domain-containing protein [Trichonephila clavipes]